MSTVYDFSATSIAGKAVKLDQFKGQPLLIDNTASACGFMPQFAGLKGLHKTYGGKHLHPSHPQSTACQRPLIVNSSKRYS